MPNTQTIIAKAKFVSTSPRKLRLIADAVRGLPLQSALDQLKALPQVAAKPILLVLQQALGNAKNNFKLSPQDLSVSSLQIHEGPRFKKRDVHAHGARFDSGIRRKRMSHIIIELKSGKAN